ncbi:MAG: 7TM domain-containing protein [Patescibacteria group bacterium]
MKTLGFLGLALLLSASVAVAEQASSEAQTEGDLQAVIRGPEDIAVGRTIILDASSSRVAGESVQYRWYIGDSFQPISRTLEAVYTPERPGSLVFRLAIHSVVNGEARESEARHAVIVFERKIVLIADATVSEDKLMLHVQSAAAAGVHLQVLQPPPGSTPLGTEEALLSLLSERSAAFAGAETTVIWTDTIAGLQALMRAAEGDRGLLEALRNQTIVLVTSRNLNTLARTARGHFSVIQPKKIIVTRKEALNPLFESPTIDVFLKDIAQRDIDHVTIDAAAAAVRPWNLLSWLVNYMLTHGVSSQTVILLLVLPIIATILAFTKQVIGITTFGLFAPSIITLSFLVLGWWVGVLFLLFILATGYVTRMFMRRWRLLYIPKVAVILTVVSLTLLILIGIGVYFHIALSRDTVFVLLIMSTLAESFLNLKTEEGWYLALWEVGETIIVALLTVLFVQWAPFQSLLLAYPELILLTIVMNVFLGRWTGLRLVEYFRFREVFRHLQEEE